MLGSFSGKIDWIISISLLSLSIIDDLSSIPVENGPFSFSLSETWLESFSKTVDVRSINLCPDLHVMFRENEVLVISWENSGTVDLSGDFKVKRIRSVLKIDPWQVDWVSERWKWVNRPWIILWNFISGVVQICDFDVKIIERMDIEDKLQVSDDWTGRFDIILISSCISQLESDSRKSFVHINNSIFWPSIYQS